MSADSNIPRECFLDLMEPLNCLSSMPANPGSSRNTSAVQTVQGDHFHLSGHWRTPMFNGTILDWRGSRSSCTVCIPSFARADGSVACLRPTEPLARVRGFRLTITSKAIN